MPTPREMMEAAQRAQRGQSDSEPAQEAVRAGRNQVSLRDEPQESFGQRGQAQTESSGRAGRLARHAAAPEDEPSRSSAQNSRAAQSRHAASVRPESGAASSGASRSGGVAPRRARAGSSARHAAPPSSSRQAGETSSSSPEVPHRPRSSELRAYITRWRMIGVRAFAVVMALGCLVGLLFFARPTTSAVEMRNLTAFPSFTAESFLNGSYFTQVSLWYADTYPLREPMVAADRAIDGLFGVSTGTGMVGGNVKADEIPVEQSEGQPEPVAVVPPAAPPDQQTLAADIQANIMEGIFVQDGAGYAIYYFSQNAADTYITAMNTAAEKLDGVSTVYSIMAPANSITLSPEQASQVGGSDQQQTLDYLRTRFNDKVKPVEIVDDIVAHRDEYLYFHTDHHWTQLGAYYAYVAFCREKGIEPKTLSSWRSVDLGVFQGTYYDTIEGMGYVEPDNITAYVPNGTNDMTYYTYGEENAGKIIDEAAAGWEPSYKYSAFAAGDQELEVIHNPQVTDGSSCLIVKDSYGCAFIPCLVDNYETIHVIDFRETDKNICDYARENNIGDVIFLTGMKIGLTDSVAATLLSEVS